MQSLTYYDQRLQQLGITEEINQVDLWRSADRKDEKNITWSDRELHPEKIFRKHDKGIEIIVYNVDRSQPSYVGDGSRWKKHWSIIRLEKPLAKTNGDEIKYLMPKGQGSYPFFPPGLLHKYDSGEQIKTLFLTEGYFKAFKGGMHGIDIVGLPSITHLKNKETGSLNEDILKLIKACNVERVVWLTDGDCLDVSKKAFNGKEEIDLYKRPASFFASISTFKQLLDDHDVDKYFLHIDTDAVWNDFQTSLTSRDQVKGLDDLLITFPHKTEEIVADINSVSKNGYWFQKFNISTGISKVRDHFHIRDANTFILFHQERTPGLKNKDFIYNGTKYRYIEEKGECEIMIPGNASLYFRVGDYYYEWIDQPNQYKQLEKAFHERLKSTITDDHGKNFIKHIPKYKAFCNVPDHINFQQVINNCFNVYSQLDYTPEEQHCTEEDCQSVIKFLQHVFGTAEVSYQNYDNTEIKTFRTIDIALDYLQLLYQQPWRKLPILCLVSRENNTGKSTFANFLRMMLGANVAIVGNQDLAGEFNAHWASKSVVVCDETKIDKQHVVEKIKSLSTSQKIWVNAKGKGQFELSCFTKFVLISNNEDNFIYASDDDIRYWVIKVPVLKSVNTHLLEQLTEEMPAFLSYLNSRKLSTENKNRMWFHPSLLKTEAFQKVINFSIPAIEKDLRIFIRDMFFDFQEIEILMTRQALHEECFKNKYDKNYLERVLKENLKVDLYHELDDKNKDEEGNSKKMYKIKRYSYPKWEMVQQFAGKPEKQRVDIKDVGRPYVFKRINFLSKEEIESVKNLA